MVQMLELEMEPFVDETDTRSPSSADQQATSSDSDGGDLLDCVTEDGYFQKLSPRARQILGVAGFFLICSLMYFFNAEVAEDEVLEDLLTKAPEASNATTSSNNDASSNVVGDSNSSVVVSPTGDVSTEPVLGELTKTDYYGLHEGLYSFHYPFISINDDGVQSTPVETPVKGDGGVCPALCDKREKARNTKFGGNLLDLSAVLKLANKAHDKLVDTLKVDYGKYFDPIFYKEQGPNATKDEPRQYSGMQPVTADGQSRNRMKRKLQLKVLKMMEALKISDEDVHGCNCRTKTGSTTESEETFTSDIPDYYQKYVFANGGHSNSAGHGNVFKQTYTQYIGDDLRLIWDALGIEMINRNMGMGAMVPTPDVATVFQETLGPDVDFFSWNYAMLDKSFMSWLHYVYRGAVNPGRPAMISIDLGNLAERYGSKVENIGLSLFHMTGNDVATNKNIPNSDDLSGEELSNLPLMVKYCRCNGAFEGHPPCGDFKWNCTKEMIKKTKIKCDCPDVKKRSGWHMGFKKHALEAHYITLPIVEMLLEGLSELVATGKDPKTLYQEIQKEENDEFESFLAVPIREKFNGTDLMNQFGVLEDELDTWFKGPSLGRTSLTPSMSRYLGHALNSDKIGGSARCDEVEYEKGYFFNRKDGVYTYTGGKPPDGEIVILAPNDFRDCWPKSECSQVVMPDYKDWFYGNWTNGPVSITFPNEKEREFYGYEPRKFKGILGIISARYHERNKAKVQYDFEPPSWNTHVSAKVNGKPVTKFRVFNRMAILEHADGIYWEPSANSDYTIEFSPKGTLPDGRSAADMHLRLQGFVLY